MLQDPESCQGRAEVSGMPGTDPRRAPEPPYAAEPGAALLWESRENPAERGADTGSPLNLRCSRSPAAPGRCSASWKPQTQPCCPEQQVRRQHPSGTTLHRCLPFLHPALTQAITSRGS